MEQKKSGNGETGKQVNNSVVDSSIAIKWLPQLYEKLKILRFVKLLKNLEL